jgi:ABC-2 type transport system permease protein
MFALYKREILSFLSSLIGYIVIGVFLTLTGLFLWVFPLDFNVLEFGYANIDGLFMLAPFVFLFLIPALTMKSFAEEKRTGTIELLLTKPLTDWQIVVAKFFAYWTLLFIALLPTLFYFYTVFQLGYPKGNIDQGGMWGSYIGLFLLGGAFVSIGILMSSITDSQIVAFILSVFASLIMYLGFEFIYSLDVFGKAALFVKSLGISHHYSSISRGVVDSRDVLYFLSLIVACLLLARLSLQSRKW